MCGIAGIISGESDSSSLIQKILDHQQKRGPDYQDYVLFQEQNFAITLGHNRLKIVDLSDQSNQPMTDVNNQYTIVFNGEIYNYLELRVELSQLGYSFRTLGDTEVILNAFAHWGPNCVSHFRGPFAFAIFDKNEKAVYLFRDRFGVKPLYYHHNGNEFYFSSLPAALGKLLKFDLNINYAARGLQYWVYDDTPEITPFVGLNALEPGYYLKINYGTNCRTLKTQLIQYYDLSHEVDKKISRLSSLNKNQVIEEFFNLLHHSIKIRLRADVNVGLSLSGGLDSTTILHFASSMNKNICGFTFGDASDPNSESTLVSNLYHNSSIKIHYIWPEPQEISAAFIRTLQMQEAPFTTASIIAQNLVYQRANQEGIKVILGGQGADETFMGYRKFFVFWLYELIQQRKPIQALNVLFQIIQMLFSEKNRLFNFWKTRFRYQKNSSNRQLLNTNLNSLNLNKSSSLLKRQIEDVTLYSLPTLLRYEDRNSLGNGVESRLPFLDHELVSFGLALPTIFKLNRGYGKWIIREAMRDKISSEIVFNRSKSGFEFNLKQLIDTGLGSSIRENLNDHYDLFKHYLNNEVSICSYFSDKNLLNNTKSFAEAVTLLWLSRLYF